MTRFLFVRTVCFKIHALFKVCISFYFWFFRLEVMVLKHLGLEGKMEDR